MPNKSGYFLGRDKQFTKAEVVYETPRRRTIKFLEGAEKDKSKNIHPEKVSWGNIYPRFFAGEKPLDIFTFKGRSLAIYNKEKTSLVPEQEPYNFLPITKDIIDSINRNDRLFLTGDGGVGKSSIIVQIAARINQPLIRVNLNLETRITDFLGKLTITSENGISKTLWTDGILPTAMRKGYWLLLDEVDFCDPAILGILHPILEPNGKLVLKENIGEVVEPHPNFRIFGTGNSVGSQSNKMDVYAGTSELNEAFLDRWVIMHMKDLDEKEEVKIIKMAVPALKRKWAKSIVRFAKDVRTAMAGQSEGTGISMRSLSLRKIIRWADKMALYRNPFKAAENVFMNNVTTADQEVLRRIMSVHFGGGIKTIGLKKAEVGPVIDNNDKPMNAKEKEFWKTLSKGRGRVSKEVLAQKITKLKEFRTKNG